MGKMEEHMKLRKIFALVLVLALALSLCVAFTACGGEEEAPFLVGAVYINSQNDVAGYTYAHHHGITTAMTQLGMDPAKQLKIVDNVLEDYDAVTAAIDTLAGQGCKLIIGISFGYIDAFADAAAKEEYKDIIFSHATGYKSNETNFNNYFGRIYQARYLAGIAAGLKTTTDSIGYVAAWGTEYAETCSGINAFALGVQSVNPDAVVKVYQISTWGDQTKEGNAAQALIDNYNCDVIAQHCDSAQAQIVAANKNKFGCGYNTDMTAQAPTAHLTAPIWNWDVYYNLCIKTAKEDPANFMQKVGIYYGGLKENFVDVSPLSANCAENTNLYVSAVKDLIISGEWDVFNGKALSYTLTDGAVTIAQNAVTLKKNDGTDCGAIDDGVIKGSMNYYVAGVTEVQKLEA